MQTLKQKYIQLILIHIDRVTDIHTTYIYIYFLAMLIFLQRQREKANVEVEVEGIMLSSVCHLRAFFVESGTPITDFKV